MFKHIFNNICTISLQLVIKFNFPFENAIEYLKSISSIYDAMETQLLQLEQFTYTHFCSPIRSLSVTYFFTSPIQRNML